MLGRKQTRMANPTSWLPACPGCRGRDPAFPACCARMVSSVAGMVHEHGETVSIGGRAVSDTIIAPGDSRLACRLRSEIRGAVLFDAPWQLDLFSKHPPF